MGAREAVLSVIMENASPLELLYTYIELYPGASLNISVKSARHKPRRDSTCLSRLERENNSEYQVSIII